MRYISQDADLRIRLQLAVLKLVLIQEERDLAGSWDFAKKGRLKRLRIETMTEIREILDQGLDRVLIEEPGILPTIKRGK